MRTPLQSHRIGSADPILVNADRLTKNFLGVFALDKVSLEIRRHEIHVLLGEKGSGKSTLITLLSGIYQPDEGSISVRGEQVHMAGAHSAQALGIMTIYRQHILAPGLSPIENVCLGLAVQRRPSLLTSKSTMRARIRQFWTEFGGRAEDLRRPVNELGVLKQRLVEIIKALAFDADLVIMDEPTDGLLDDERANLLDYIRRMRALGTSVLLVTHHLKEFIGLADRVTVLRDGLRIATMTISETSIDKIICAMHGYSLRSNSAVAGRLGDMRLPEECSGGFAETQTVSHQIVACLATHSLQCLPMDH
jgi:ribose transport system ATP-binding protein